jgi:hypothetical protein
MDPGLIRSSLKSKLIKKFYQLRGINEQINLPHQKNLLEKIFNRPEFLIIILDACRYDYFKYWIKENKPCFLNKLIKVNSKGTNTVEWFTNTFKQEKYNLCYISGNPYINSMGVTKVGNLAKTKMKKIIDAWKEWDEKHNTVMPEKINSLIIDNINHSRIISHYLQPHQPYVGNIDFPDYLYYKTNWHNIKKEPPKIKQIEKHSFNKKEKKIIKRAYYNNLNFVCNSIFNLISQINRLVIITSDHSELLGDNNLWFHNNGHPYLKIVPWLVINHKNH